jgi:hypothetical protein
MTKRKYQQKKSKKKNKKRKSLKSGSSGDKRQRLSSDDSEIDDSTMSEAFPEIFAGETNSSEALPSAGETKEDGAAARRRQRYANSAETNTKPCIAILYEKIKWKRIGSKYIKGHFVKSGDPITFTSRLEASEVLGGMDRKTIGLNIDRKSRSEIKGGDYDGLYVMLSNTIVEPTMFGDIEIKPAPARSERVKGDLYVVNDIVRIYGGHGTWNCVQHNTRLNLCGECGGASLCKCGIRRVQCRKCCVQPLLVCTVCSTTWTSACHLEEHMRTHTGDKPFKCNQGVCAFRCAQNGDLTRHKGQVHDIGKEQCTICYDNCYRPRSWIDGNSKEEVKCCRTCDREFNGESVRVEYDWSDCLDEHFHPEFRLCTNTQVNSCNKSKPDALYAVPALILPALILHGECDENQHQGKLYSCEEKRISELYDQFCGMQYIVVRVNPDAYTHPDGRDKPEWEMRKVLMIKVMKACLTKKWDTMIHVVYMFYSENNPNITRNFSKTMLYDAEDVDNFCKN